MASLETIPEIISMARRSGLVSVADRLEYLYKLDREDGEEPINHNTMHMLVSFMIDNPELATDDITLGPDGFVNVSWDWTRYMVTVEFLPTGNVWFTHCSKKNDSEQFKIHAIEEISLDNIPKTIIPIMRQST